jgi:hypothetical protein
MSAANTRASFNMSFQGALVNNGTDCDFECRWQIVHAPTESEAMRLKGNDQDRQFQAANTG